MPIDNSNAGRSAESGGLTAGGRLTALNLRVLRDIEAKMHEGGDRVGGEPAVPQPSLTRRERYHARRLAVRGRLRRVETDAPWFARRTVLYGSVPEPSVSGSRGADPQSVVREPVAALRQPDVHGDTAHGAYRDALFSGVPLYTTRLVRERMFTFPTRDQVRSPADAAAVLAEYFSDRDREEFVVAFLDTVMRDRQGERRETASRYPLLHPPIMADSSFVRRTPTAVAWLDFLRAVGRAPLTLDAYGRALDGFLAFCDRHGHDPEHADLPVVAAYLQALRERGLAAATLRQALCVVRLWSEHLVGLGVRDRNPVPEGGSRGGVYGVLGGGPSLGAPRLGAGRARAGLLPRAARYPWVPTDDEWLRFLQVASTRSARDRLMLALAYAGALRRQEVVGLAVADVDVAHRLVTVRPEVAKRGRGRVVAYPREATPLLVAYLERRRALSADSGPLFLSESNRNRGHALSKWTWHDVVGRIAADAGLPQFTTHTLRHLRLTHLAVKGLGLHEIATYAGHRSLESTMAYVHLSGRHIDERVTATLLEVEAAASGFLFGGTP